MRNRYQSDGTFSKVIVKSKQSDNEVIAKSKKRCTCRFGQLSEVRSQAWVDLGEARFQIWVPEDTLYEGAFSRVVRNAGEDCFFFQQYGKKSCTILVRLELYCGGVLVRACSDFF